MTWRARRLCTATIASRSPRRRSRRSSRRAAGTTATSSARWRRRRRCRRISNWRANASPRGRRRRRRISRAPSARKRRRVVRKAERVDGRVPRRSPERATSPRDRKTPEAHRSARHLRGGGCGSRRRRRLRRRLPFPRLPADADSAEAALGAARVAVEDDASPRDVRARVSRASAASRARRRRRTRRVRRLPRRWTARRWLAPARRAHSPAPRRGRPCPSRLRFWRATPTGRRPSRNSVWNRTSRSRLSSRRRSSRNPRRAHPAQHDGAAVPAHARARGGAPRAQQGERKTALVETERPFSFYLRDKEAKRYEGETEAERAKRRANKFQRPFKAKEIPAAVREARLPVMEAEAARRREEAKAAAAAALAESKLPERMAMHGAGGAHGAPPRISVNVGRFKPAPRKEVPDFDALHEAFFRRLKEAKKNRRDGQAGVQASREGRRAEATGTSDGSRRTGSRMRNVFPRFVGRSRRFAPR